MASSSDSKLEDDIKAASAQFIELLEETKKKFDNLNQFYEQSSQDESVSKLAAQALDRISSDFHIIGDTLRSAVDKLKQDTNAAILNASQSIENADNAKAHYEALQREVETVKKDLDSRKTELTQQLEELKVATSNANDSAIRAREHEQATDAARIAMDHATSTLKDSFHRLENELRSTATRLETELQSTKDLLTGARLEIDNLQRQLKDARDQSDTLTTYRETEAARAVAEEARTAAFTVAEERANAVAEAHQVALRNQKELLEGQRKVAVQNYINKYADYDQVKESNKKCIQEKQDLQTRIGELSLEIRSIQLKHKDEKRSVRDAAAKQYSDMFDKANESIKLSGQSMENLIKSLDKRLAVSQAVQQGIQDSVSSSYHTMIDCRDAMLEAHQDMTTLTGNAITRLENAGEDVSGLLAELREETDEISKDAIIGQRAESMSDVLRSKIAKLDTLFTSLSDSRQAMEEKYDKAILDQGVLQGKFDQAELRLKELEGVQQELDQLKTVEAGTAGQTIGDLRARLDLANRDAADAAEDRKLLINAQAQVSIFKDQLKTANADIQSMKLELHNLRAECEDEHYDRQAEQDQIANYHDMLEELDSLYRQINQEVPDDTQEDVSVLAKLAAAFTRLLDERGTQGQKEEVERLTRQVLTLTGANTTLQADKDHWQKRAEDCERDKGGAVRRLGQKVTSTIRGQPSRQTGRTTPATPTPIFESDLTSPDTQTLSSQGPSQATVTKRRHETTGETPFRGARPKLGDAPRRGGLPAFDPPEPFDDHPFGSSEQGTSRIRSGFRSLSRTLTSAFPAGRTTSQPLSQTAKGTEREEPAGDDVELMGSEEPEPTPEEDNALKVDRIHGRKPPAPVASQLRWREPDNDSQFLQHQRTMYRAIWKPDNWTQEHNDILLAELNRGGQFRRVVLDFMRCPERLMDQGGPPPCIPGFRDRSEIREPGRLTACDRCVELNRICWGLKRLEGTEKPKIPPEEKMKKESENKNSQRLLDSDLFPKSAFRRNTDGYYWEAFVRPYPRDDDNDDDAAGTTGPVGGEAMSI